ncbi:MAG: sugar ABC transporter permease [Acidobacteriota bacterium]|nr:sugar ABC transporter permease [Acidobacteriota bacterium]MDE3138965.1 sugar ABC transporter permease [Acidobacteriota bacterium]
MSLSASLSASSSARRRPPASLLVRRRRRVGVLLVIPALALVGLLIAYPIAQAVYYSFTNWDGLSTQWVGPSAWTQAFHNPTMWTALKNNAELLLSVPFALGIPLLVAVMLHQRVAGWKIFRSIYFLPTAISWVVIGLVAEHFFAYSGTLNSLLSDVGLGAVHTNMLGQENEALIALGITFIFSMIGTNTMLFLTGLATLDPSLEEAARIDGAGAWRIFRHITLPHLSRFIQLAFVMTVISAFSALFSLIFVMTGGGPGYSTTTMEFLVYQTGFNQSQFGTAALYGIILFVITALVGIVQLRLIGAKES